MDRKTLSFIAIAVSMLYGVSFVVFRDNDAYAAVGGVVVAIMWMAVGFFGRDAHRHDHDRHA